MHAIASSDFAGVEQYVARLAGAQAAAGHRVTVLGGAPEPMAAAAGPDVAIRGASGVLDLLRGLTALSDRPDVLNAHMTASELGALSRIRSTPVVATRHFAAGRGSTPTRRVTLRAVRPLLAAQISVSEYVAGAIGEPSTVVHPGLPSRPALPRRPTRSIVVSGRLEPEKHVHVAIGAFAASGLAADGWTLSVVGDGSCRPGLVADAARLGVADAVRFLGHLDEPRPVLGEASALLAPCPVEALGLAVLEAMADAVPVVASAAGGHLETVAAVCPELTFAPGDVDAAAALLREVAAHPARAERAGRALRDHQQRHFTLEQQVAGTDLVYAEAAR